MELIITCAWTPLLYSHSCHCLPLLLVMSRSLYQILSVRTINNGWGYPSHWPVSDGPRWWAMFVSWPHTSNTNNISDPRHSSAADQCGDNWANNEDSEFEWSEKYLMFEQENYLDFFRKWGAPDTMVSDHLYTLSHFLISPHQWSVLTTKLFGQHYSDTMWWMLAE